MKSITKRLISLSTLSLSLVGTFSYVNNQDAHADSYFKSARTTFPKSMRGTWYSYDGYNHRMVKTNITAKKMKSTGDKKGFNYTTIIKNYKNHSDSPSNAYLKKTTNWSFIESVSKIDGYKWIVIRGWNQTAGSVGYQSVHKFNGHEVLTIGGGPGPIVDATTGGHAYRTKALANKLHNKHYPKFQYAASDNG